MTVDTKPGARFHSSVCSTEVIVIKAGAASLDLRCGGAPLLPVGTDAEAGGTPDPAFAEGTLLGKRYTDEAGTLELLCTKAGAGTLSLEGTALQIKDAKPLPASD